MPSLNWIGKDKTENHDKEVAFRLLKKNEKLSLGKNSQNLIVEGDNLEALKALMPHYAGQVKCVYIDPPYNTGNEGWVYNDKVNSPKIKEWLGKVVGPEGEDLTRHDKWLCMMYPRLKLLRDLLRNDGVIFISIDDNEHCYLKLMMDEIFGEENFLTSLIWKKKQGGGNDSVNFVIEHEYIVCYARNIPSFNINLDKGHILDDALYPFKDKNGEYGLITLDKTSIRQSDSLIFDIKGPDGNIYKPRIVKGKPSCWRWGKDKVKKDYNMLVFKNGKVYTKYYRPVGVPPRTLLVDSRFGRTESGKDAITKIFGNVIFSYPKPVELIKHLINISTVQGDTILDSFSGSGTTGQAVMELNKEDGGNRKFILVEIEPKIAQKITSERVRRVAKNLGGDFEYATLGEPLFGSSGVINQKVSFNDFASYIYFTETRTNINPKKIKRNFIGEFNGREFYLIFKEKDNNVLNRAFLSKLSKTNLPKVVYADKCLIDQTTLDKYKIIFKQIPYSVKTY